MHHPVIFHADRELARAGFTTLRFNFRGVGGSEGVHDAGRGEVDDVAAASEWLRASVPDAPLLSVGYSFGSWCVLRHALRDASVVAIVAIGLPVKLYDVAALPPIARPVAVVQAARDEFGSPEEVRAALATAGIPSRVLTVAGTSHLFPGAAPRAGLAVVEAADWCLSAGRTYLD
jgi:alpha/beta superfamily hydrolase